MILNLDLKERSYDIIIERGVIKKAAEQLNLKRKVMIITDAGVPSEYASCVLSQSKVGYVEVIPEGENGKSLAVYENVLSKMLEYGFTRSDCVVSVGGGVAGDLTGFCAASYMRGIDFYNIPTTALAQIDASIGGKTAVNLRGIKNIIGAFYQPKKVLIDPDLLITLPPRQLSNGLCEAVKMAMTSDAELFEIMEEGNIYDNIDKIIERSLKIKKSVVEKDEREGGLRKILNFGHTIGHGIESEEKLNGLYHGECVALGMLPMCSTSARERLTKVLKNLHLPTSYDFDIQKIIEAMRHDKKSDGDCITVVLVEKIGTFELKKMSYDELTERFTSYIKKENK